MIRKIVSWYPHWREHDLPFYQDWLSRPVEFVVGVRIYLGLPTW